MSLYGILNIGGSALAAQTAALQVTGNNLANSANPNYTREVAEFTPGIDVPTASGLLGTGVEVSSIQRQVDTSLQQRLLGANSDNSSATSYQTLAGQVQSVFNALSPDGTSAQLNQFFSDWSTYASQPTAGNAQLVVNDGQTVASAFNSLSSNLTTLSQNVQQNISQAVSQVNGLANEIATLNQQIVAAAEGGAQQPNALLDQRDADLTQLSQLVNIQTIVQPTGSVNVFIGSEQLVQNSTAATLTASPTTNAAGQITTSINFQSNGAQAAITSGQLNGLAQSQNLVNNTEDSVNALATNLISAVNNIHASGQGSSGFTSISSTNPVLDPNAALGSAAAGLAYPVTSGSFTINVTANGPPPQTTSTQLSLKETGSPSDTTLNSLANSLNGVSGVQATITNGQLTISATTPNTQITFGGDGSGDTSGVLAALGINTFFTGSNASTIGLNSQVANTNSPQTLAVSSGGLGNGDTQAATAISNLNDTPLNGLNDTSISQSYDSLIQTIGTAAADATNSANATASVQQTLQGQQQALSGVSTDEEALNMIVEQRSYQGAAQLISTINQLMQTLLNITIA